MSSHTDPQQPQTPAGNIKRSPGSAALPRNQKAVKAAHRARLAPYISWGILLFGLLVFGAFLYQAGLFSYFTNQPIKIVSKPLAKPDQVSGEESRLSGFDGQKLPYEINAQRGHQDPSDHDIFHLEDLTSKFRKADGETYDVSAKAGIYNKKSKNMQLSGDVTIFSPDRYTVVMDKADVDTVSKDVQSQSPVVVDLPSGKITANGLQMSDNGHKILLTNGVKARFNTSEKKGVDGQ